MKGRYQITLLLVVLLLAMFPAASAWSGQTKDKYKLKEGAKGKLCLVCHVTFQDKMKEPFVHTPLRQGECTGCHNPHTSSRAKLLDENAERVCVRCHQSVIRRDAVSVHAVVAEGKCLLCHDPHSAQTKNNLLSKGNALCFRCHKNMQESLPKVKRKHDPVERNCLTCHTPHASADADSLLKEKLPPLCTKCHKTDGPVFSKRHMNYPVSKSLCTGCHDPHGSDQAGIIYDTVHKPVANRMCNQCHEDADSPAALKTKKAGLELCRSCHTPMMNDLFDKKRLHWPIAAKGACLSCHSPHASKQRSLLTQPQSELCLGCHRDTAERTAQAKVQHGPVKDGTCTGCHSPHAADSPLLFARAEVPDLCGTCHDWRKHTSHPVGEKIRDPRDKNIAVDCISCHRGHGTEYKRLLLNGTVMDLCVQCHEKYRR